MTANTSWKWSQIVLCIGLACLIGFQSIPSDGIWLSVFWVASVFSLFFVRGPAPLKRLELYALISFAVLFLSLLYSQWVWVSFWTACSLSLLSIGFIIFLNDGSESTKRFLKTAIVAIALLNGGFAVFMSVFHVGRNGGMLSDANLAANLCVIAILILSEFIVVDAKKYDFWSWAGLFLLGVATFSLQSRAAVLVLFVSLTLIAVFCGSSHRKPLLSIFLTLVVTYFLSNFLLSSQVAEGLSPFNRIDSFNYRLDLWVSGLKLFLDSPWFGSGLGTFSLVYPAVREPTEIGTVGFFAHNDYLQLLLELGLVGFVACMLFPIVTALNLINGVVRTSDASQRTRGLFILSIIFTIAAHSFVNFIIYHPLLAFIFGAFLGIGTSRFAGGEEVPVTQKIPPKAILWPSVAVLVLIGLFGLISSTADQKAKRVITKENAMASSPSLSRDAYYSLLALSYFSPLNSSVSDYLIVSETNTAVAMADMDLGHELAEKTISRIQRQELFKDPNCVQFTAKSRLNWMLGKKDEATNALKEFLRDAPDCVQARMVVADALIKTGQTDQAINILNAGVDRIRFKEVVESESKALFTALEEALRAAGREGEADAIRIYLRLNG